MPSTMLSEDSWLLAYMFFGFTNWISILYIGGVEVAQLCLTLCDTMDGSPPGSSVHGILQQEYWSG